MASTRLVAALLRDGADQGKALRDAALDHLGKTLTFPTFDGMHAGIADVRAACEPQTLAGFAWDCFGAWLRDGAPCKHGWALTALCLLGNDDTPKKSDDANVSGQAVERFKLFKKDVRTFASQQLLRLEVAMRTRRRWAPAVFRKFLVAHPLVRHIEQRLVWGVYALPNGANHGGKLQACFRVAEDGRAITADDEPFDPPAAGRVFIGVPHALELSTGDAVAFGQILADDELLQPFAQLGRESWTLNDNERAALALGRWQGTQVPTGRVLGLVNRGWRRGDAQDGSGIWYFIRPLPNGRFMQLDLEPGIIVGLVNECSEQTLVALHYGRAVGWDAGPHAEAFGSLDAITASALIRDMERLLS